LIRFDPSRINPKGRTWVQFGFVWVRFRQFWPAENSYFTAPTLALIQFLRWVRLAKTHFLQGHHAQPANFMEQLFKEHLTGIKMI
jgi:hypothetical protein